MLILVPGGHRPDHQPRNHGDVRRRGLARRRARARGHHRHQVPARPAARDHGAPRRALRRAQAAAGRGAGARRARRRGVDGQAAHDAARGDAAARLRAGGLAVRRPARPRRPHAGQGHHPHAAALARGPPLLLLAPAPPPQRGERAEEAARRLGPGVGLGLLLLLARGRGCRQAGRRAAAAAHEPRPGPRHAQGLDGRRRLRDRGPRRGHVVRGAPQGGDGQDRGPARRGRQRRRRRRAGRRRRRGGAARRARVAERAAGRGARAGAAVPAEPVSWREVLGLGGGGGAWVFFVVSSVCCMIWVYMVRDSGDAGEKWALLLRSERETPRE